MAPHGGLRAPGVGVAQGLDHRHVPLRDLSKRSMGECDHRMSDEGRRRQAHGMPDLFEHSIPRRLDHRLMKREVRLDMATMIVARGGSAHGDHQGVEGRQRRGVDSPRGLAGGQALEGRADRIDLEQLVD